MTAHNTLYEAGGPGAPQFDMEINQFADLSFEDFNAKYASGLRINPERAAKMENFEFDQPKGRKLSSVKRISEDEYNESLREQGFDAPNPFEGNVEVEEQEDGTIVPTYKNWVEEGAVTVPYDQGSCGGCWAFSTAAAVESMRYLFDNAPLEELSVQQLLDCDDNNYACGGGWMYEGFQYVSEHGLLRKDDYPSYNRRKNSCRTNDREGRQNAAIKDIGYVERDGQTNDQLKAMIAVQPISVGIKNGHAMQLYRSGIATEQWLHCSS